MCGIAGYYGTNLIGDEDVRACLTLMRRRGPDASGTYRCEAQAGRQLERTGQSNLLGNDFTDEPIKVVAAQLIQHGTGLVSVGADVAVNELINWCEMGRGD